LRLSPHLRIVGIQPRELALSSSVLRHGGGNGRWFEPRRDQIRWRYGPLVAFDRNVLLPFLDAHLKDAAPKDDIATVTAFETGANVWRRYDQWPQFLRLGM